MTGPVQTRAKLEKDGPVAVIRFEGDITSASREAVLGSYEHIPPETRGVVLDFSKVPYLNSSGIALVIQLLMNAGNTGRKVSVFGLTPHFEKVFKLVGLAKYTSLHENEAAARGSVEAA